MNTILFPSNKKSKNFFYFGFYDDISLPNNMNCDYHIIGKEESGRFLYGFIQFHSPKTEMKAEEIIRYSTTPYNGDTETLIRNFKQNLVNVWESGVPILSKKKRNSIEPFIVTKKEKSQKSQKEFDSWINDIIRPKGEKIFANMKENVRLLEEEERQEKEIKDKQREYNRIGLLSI